MVLPRVWNLLFPPPGSSFVVSSLSVEGHFEQELPKAELLRKGGRVGTGRGWGKRGRVRVGRGEGAGGASCADQLERWPPAHSLPVSLPQQRDVFSGASTLSLSLFQRVPCLSRTNKSVCLLLRASSLDPTGLPSPVGLHALVDGFRLSPTTAPPLLEFGDRPLPPLSGKLRMSMDGPVGRGRSPKHSGVAGSLVLRRAAPPRLIHARSARKRVPAKECPQKSAHQVPGREGRRLTGGWAARGAQTKGRHNSAEGSGGFTITEHLASQAHEATPYSG